jgi:uncharacterized membrane protein YphA (DoxX/SURF4 family)
LKQNRIVMKWISNFFRIVIGIVFVFSGFVKVVDPLGVQYKFVDYFLAMGLDFLQPMALTFGLLMSLAELMIGISLLFNLKPKLGAWGTLMFMAVFLPLTLWVAIANPVHDCGCFGDALVISNWATFWKNVVIMFMTIIVFLQRRKFKPTLPSSVQWLSLIVVAGVSVWIGVYSIKHLPVLDFRPYRIGENIREGMNIPESEIDNVPDYETTLIYENTETGETREFDVEEIPDEDTWEWKETKNKLIEEGYVPPIHDFSITTVPVNRETDVIHEVIDPASLYEVKFVFEIAGETQEFFIDELPNENWTFVELHSDKHILAENVGLIFEKDGETAEFTLFDLPDESWMFIDATYYNENPNIAEPAFEDYSEDITDIVLSDEGYSFFLVAHDLTKTSKKNNSRINALYDYALANDINFYCLTASTESDIHDYIEKTDANYDFFNTDPITLKTMVRSNPGLLLIKQGTVLDKWHVNDIPTLESLDGQLVAQSIEKQVERGNRYYVLTMILALLFGFTALFLLIQYLLRKRIIVDRDTWN